MSAPLDLFDPVVSVGEPLYGMRPEGEGAAASSPEGWSLGVCPDLSFQAYQAAPAVSKSALWTAVNRSPAHARVEREPSAAMALGTAVHCAVLEPDAFERRYVRGPDDRRGGKWRDALEEHGEALLTSGDYDDAVRIRDALMRDATIRALVGGPMLREASGFWVDPETRLLCRCRPDGYRPDLGLMLDLKTARDARPRGFATSVAEYGYHAQEAFYTDGWKACGQTVDAFVFVAVETTPPHAVAIYELEPAAVEEGRAHMRVALDLWAKCAAADAWPAYPPGVQPLDIPQWAYRHTDPPA
ncbi:MAG: exonuclease VIII [Betaproteobacteria bacterium]|nr:exonuclease VIII [Betaproteobacteria bacterium]